MIFGKDQIGYFKRYGKQRPGFTGRAQTKPGLVLHLGHLSSFYTQSLGKKINSVCLLRQDNGTDIF